MLTVEKLQEAQTEYQEQANYYKALDFQHLSEQFQNMSSLCADMIATLIAKNGQTNEAKS